MYIIDTDILIDVQRGYQPAVNWFRELIELPAVPGLVVMELIQDAQNTQQVHNGLKLVAPLAIVWPAESACNQALLHFASHHLSDGVGLIDSLIAACAITVSAALPKKSYGGKRQANTGSAGALARYEREARNSYGVKRFEI